MRRAARATAWTLSLFVSLAADTSQAADLVWEVESPFRFFKPSRSFGLHEAAFKTVRGDPLISSGVPNGPSTIPIARMSRRRTAVPRRPASAISKAASAGRRRPWPRPATRTTAVLPDTRRCVSVDTPGVRRQKITFGSVPPEWYGAVLSTTDLSIKSQSECLTSLVHTAFCYRVG